MEMLYLSLRQDAFLVTCRTPSRSGDRSERIFARRSGLASIRRAASSPSTRRLAEEYETSHMTVRRALDSMIELGELVGRMGVGVFVADTSEQES